ncbi:MAG TPA: ribosome biogenesis GTPase Der [Chromatiaceae bacterium]|jgi:GTP-binding protein|nr:ribosome biogenesis GTPase Der [Chromatiaceae bacterium]
MLSVIAIAGRPNVGKSTLFNRLTRTRDALVANKPGLTRDRQYGMANIDDRNCLIVDTGGLSGDEAGIDALMAKQARAAIDEADLVLFMVDAKDGLTSLDEDISQFLRQSSKPVLLVVNKIDGHDPAVVSAEFHALGRGEMMPITASQGGGIRDLGARILESLPAPIAEDVEAEVEQGIRVAFAGRPNVGKSTMLNRMLGEERVITYDQPGTTRDSIFVPFERDGQRYTLIDTAGVRRRGKVFEAVEKFSVIKTLQAIEQAHVVVFLVDAQEGIVDQDATLLGFILEQGRSLVLTVNKWDGLDFDHRDFVKRELDRRLPYLDFAKPHYVSALHGSGIGNLFDDIRIAHASAMRAMSTSELNRVLEQALDAHQPPLRRGRRIKLRYAHQGGYNPPRIVIHGNQTEGLPESYRRYLEKAFRKAFDLVGTPVRLSFRTGDNPFKGKPNKLKERIAEQRGRTPKKTRSR